MNSEHDPIVAIATAPGRGGIGIVRVSGQSLDSMIEPVLGIAAAQLRPRHAMHARFRDDDGSAIDEGIALWFPAPHSYTGENVLELQCHGGPVVMQMLLARCLRAGRAIGLRIAEPGEFTRRAFLNDKMDLAQAEAVADLIDAASEAAARSATRSLAGEFSSAVNSLAAQLTELRALVEATLDFPEEEIDFLQSSDARGRLIRAREELQEIFERAEQGAVLRDGLNIALVGAPNVGKSSLMNALAGEDVAIVTPIAGTTRDRIQQRILIAGIPLNVVDTAGLRPTDDPVERIGIARTLTEVERADVVLHIVDSLASDADAQVLAQIAPRRGRGVPTLTVINKIDLLDEAPRAEDARVYLSALDGRGVDLLREELKRIAGWELDTDAGAVFLARARHLQALAEAAAHLSLAAEHTDQGDAPLELLAEELRLAGRALGSITGAVSADALLGVIFSRFCIGK